jgi:outer membrane cobalamin receptor
LLGRITAPATIISREQIAAQQATSATELLRQVPGIHIDQAGARGSISSVRAVDAYRTLLQANSALSVMDYIMSGSYLDNGRPVEGSRFQGATLQANLGVHRTDPTGARTLDAYARVELAVHWTLTRHGQNLFDAVYEERIGFPAPGVSPRTGVRASF